MCWGGGEGGAGESFSRVYNVVCDTASAAGQSHTIKILKYQLPLYSDSDLFLAIIRDNLNHILKCFKLAGKTKVRARVCVRVCVVRGCVNRTFDIICQKVPVKGRKDMFYLTTHLTHFSYQKVPVKEVVLLLVVILVGVEVIIAILVLVVGVGVVGVVDVIVVIIKNCTTTTTITTTTTTTTTIKTTTTTTTTTTTITTTTTTITTTTTTTTTTTCNCCNSNSSQNSCNNFSSSSDNFTWGRSNITNSYFC